MPITIYDQEGARSQTLEFATAHESRIAEILEVFQDVDRVGVIAPTCIESIAAWRALLLAGKTPVMLQYPTPKLSRAYWQREIARAVREADLVVVCLSSDSIEKRGYVQREIKDVLDVADEMPDGRVFVVPARLEACEVPERLRRWQWVNLYEPHGYDLLLKTANSIALLGS